MDATTIQNKVTHLLKNTDEEQKQTLRSFVKIPLESKIKIFEEQKKIFHPLKDKNKDSSLSILSYASFIIAIEKYSDNSNNVDKNAIEIRAKSVRKFAKKEKLLAKWALIKELKNSKGLSFRQISDYLKKYHKLEVVHSTIFDLWNELEKDKQKGDK